MGQRAMLLAGLTLCAIGLAWLSFTAAQMSYLGGVVLPMLLIGFGQGWVLAPLTVAGVAGVDARNAGAASGIVNVAHQLGASLGLAVLVVVYAVGHAPVSGAAGMARHTGVTLGAAAVLLLLALLVSARTICFDGGDRPPVPRCDPPATAASLNPLPLSTQENAPCRPPL